MKKIAIYSNVCSPEDGGGILYILSIASVLAQNNNVEIFWPVKIAPQKITELLPVSLTNVEMKTTNGHSGSSLLQEIKDVLSNTRSDMVVIQSTQVPRLRKLRNAFLICEFPFQPKPRISERGRLAAFTSIIANSRYTAGWIRNRWGASAEVLSPPVFLVEPLEKQPWILGVGRFIGGIRSKRQIEIINMFKELVDAGLEGWQLHLAGTIHDRNYADQAVESAQGLPVYFHFDIPRAELEALYGKSSIFWHAVGAGVDPQKNPDRMEHFGIATAEAMSAGCVPVVINRGGQPEIVDRNSGVLWDSYGECFEATLGLIRDDARRQRLSTNAIEAANRFSFPVFAERVREIFEAR